MVRKSKGVTEKHKKILEFLLNFNTENGYPPTIRQIGESINVASTSQVTYYLKQLETMGVIERDEHSSRGIRIIEDAAIAILGEAKRIVAQAGTALDDLFSVPLLGRIVASEPIPMPTSAGGYDQNGYFGELDSVELARSLFSPKEKIEELFALEVQGDSMIDAMINEGDIIIMRKAQDAINGEMVAVWLDDDNTTTLKYFYRENNRVRLQPANPTMQPIYIENPEHLRIMGKVVMVVRQVQSLAA